MSFAKREIERQLEAWPPDTSEENEAVKAMIAWFVDHYEDPGDNCPYSSADGGYQYIYGGPYDAAEELSDQFPDASSRDLGRCADILAAYGWHWSGKPKDEEDSDGEAAAT